MKPSQPSNKEIDAMETLSPPNDNKHISKDDLKMRFLSALIAAPVAVGAVILGFPYADILGTLIFLTLLWEWKGISGLGFSHPLNWLNYILFGWMVWGTGSWGISFGVFAAYVLVMIIYDNIALAIIMGGTYITLGMGAMVSLAKFYPSLLLWAILIVWATDIGAYAVGKMLGGPKLAPRISPGKTWSGLVGGSVIGTSVGIIAVPYCHIIIDSSVGLLALPLFVTIFAHLGDLFESAEKRHFKVKDSSRLMPGHGGLFDRLDSLLLVAVFLLTVNVCKALT
jgi:phosphatidate cytidylyltransferase